MEKITPDGKNKKCLSLIYNRALISRGGELIKDPKAEEIAACIDNSSHNLRYNKYLSLFLGVRARVLDDIAEEFIHAHPDCTVLHLGCGLDSRCLRLKSRPAIWYDLDFPEVIELRKKFFAQSDAYRMIGSDASQLEWLDSLEDGGTVLVIAEGFSMFLSAEENISLLAAFRDKFDLCEYAFDAYTDRAVLYTMGKEAPVRGQTIIWGLEKPGLLEKIGGVKFLRAYNFNYSKYLNTFPLPTRFMYKIIYGKQSMNRLYRIYRYRISRSPELLET